MRCPTAKLIDALQRKRPGRKNDHFLHDSALPYVAKMSRPKLQELGWEVLPLPPYSPPDYHFFWALKQRMGEVISTVGRNWNPKYRGSSTHFCLHSGKGNS